MTKLLVLAVFLFPVIGLTAPAPQAADYNLTVHVTHSKLVSLGGNNWVEFSPRLSAVINGKKVELFEMKIRSAVLHTGDYKARIVRTGESDTKSRMGQQADPTPAYEDAITYEFLLPDGSKRKFILVGEEE
jgi:hypothetical protein